MEPTKTHGAAYDAVDSATAGTSSSPEVSANMLGVDEAVDSATAGTSLFPEVSANMLGVDEYVDSATAGTSPSPEVSGNMLGDYEAVDSATARISPSLGVPTTDFSINEPISCTSTTPKPSPVSMFCENVTRLDVYNAFVNKSKSISIKGRPRDLDIAVRIEILSSLLGEKYRNLIREHSSYIKRILCSFISKCDTKYNACYRRQNIFIKRHYDWLNKPFVDDIKNATQHSNQEPGYSVSQRHLQQRPQRKRFQEHLSKEPPEKVIKSETVFLQSVDVATSEVSCSSNTTVVQSIKNIINTCGETTTKAIEISNLPQPTPQPYTPEEALGFLIDSNMSVQAYESTRLDLAERGFPAFPSYNKIIEYKKNCYPDQPIVTTEIEAQVTLQTIIDHTFKRIIQCSEEIIDMLCEKYNLSSLHCTFDLSWGFDGSTGQSLYNQKNNESSVDSTTDECSLFATTLVPLRVTYKDKVIWANPSPTSYQFCRPIRIQYRKDSSDLILSEKAYIDNQIKSLAPSTACTTKANTVNATLTRLTLSMFDGKVTNILTGTNSQLECPICYLAASQFNNLELSFSKPCDPSTLHNGITPLHAWIRVLEFLLDLGYKNDPQVQTGTVLKKSAEARIINSRKRKIQDEIWQKLGLLVDVAKQNGTTNDGNTARIALSDQNRQLFAKILYVQKWLLDDLHTILVTISCGLPVDAKKFGDFCAVVATRYVSTYNWHPMTVTIHKILIHGKYMIEKSVLPVGLLPEQAAETRNKMYRIDCDHHTSKSERMISMLDLFLRALESSDPVISSIRLKERQKRLKDKLSNDVRCLLKHIEESSCSLSSDDSDEDEDSLSEVTEYGSSNYDNMDDTIILTREIDILESEDEK